MTNSKELQDLIAKTQKQLLTLITEYETYLNSTGSIFGFFSNELKDQSEAKIQSVREIKRFIEAINPEKDDHDRLIDYSISKRDRDNISIQRLLPSITAKTNGTIFLESYDKILGNYKSSLAGTSVSTVDPAAYNKDQKIAMVGERASGITKLILVSCEDRWTDDYVTSMGVEFKPYRMPSAKGRATAFFHDMIHNDCSYHGVKGTILIAIDLTKEEPERIIDHWLEEIGKASPKATIFIVGTKADIKNEDISKKTREYSQKRGFKYFEVSAKERTGIEEMMTAAVCAACGTRPARKPKDFLVSAFTTQPLDVDNILKILEQNPELIRLLINGKSLLNLAIEANSLALVKGLINCHANPNVRNEAGETSLYLAAELGNAEIVSLLINEGGVSLNEVNRDGMTPFHAAVGKGHEPVVRLLINAGVNIHATDTDGRTSLHIAAEAGGDALVRLLINENADIEAIDKDGNTPLHTAVRHSNASAVRHLIEAGANIEATNKKGKTPLNVGHLPFAKINHAKEDLIKKLLEEAKTSLLYPDFKMPERM